MSALGWRAVAWASSALAAMAVRGIARRGWTSARGKPPPQNPASPRVSWRDAIGWGVFVGVLAGVTRLVTRRGAAAAWNAAFDENPVDD